MTNELEQLVTFFMKDRRFKKIRAGRVDNGDAVEDGWRAELESANLRLEYKSKIIVGVIVQEELIITHKAIGKSLHYRNPNGPLNIGDIKSYIQEHV